MTTWAQVAEAKAREALPRLQRELDAARSHLDELRERQAAVERATAALDPDADPDLAVAVQVAAELLPPVVAEAEAAVTGAMAERRVIRADLLPEESVWSKLSAARQTDSRRREEMSRAHLHLGELQRGRAAALGTVRDTPADGNMVALAAAEAQLRMTDRALPAARHAVTAAEETAQQARAEVEAMQARTHALRLDVLTGEPVEAEAALVELLDLVGPERSGLMRR